MPKDKHVITTLAIGAAAAARRAGVTTRQLNHWIDQGYVTASARQSEGQGPAHERRFAPSDVQDLNALARLVQAGLSPKAASVVVRRLRLDGVVLPQEAVLVGHGKKVLLVDRDENVYDVLRGLQGAFALFLGIDVPTAEGPRPRVSTGSLSELPRIRRARARVRRTA